MCDPYTPADAATTDIDEENCEWSPVMRTETDKDGNCEYDGLLEGYYSVWFASGAFVAANVGTDGKVDEDVDSTSAVSHTESVMGRNYYSTENDFIVYNDRACKATALDGQNVTRVMADSAVTATGTGGDEWHDRDSNAYPDNHIQGQRCVGDGTVTSRGAIVEYTGVDDLGELAVDGNYLTVTVTAASAYHDEDFTFSVTRTAAADTNPGRCQAML